VLEEGLVQEMEALKLEEKWEKEEVKPSTTATNSGEEIVCVEYIVQID
jgi:hypothetical protein